MRLEVLVRDGYRCQLAGPKCKSVANHVDHIVSVSDGGAPFDPSNLRASCASCNIGKRNTEVAERARGVRAGDDPTPAFTGYRSRAEQLRDTGYDWPPPPGGWPDDD